MQIIQQIKKSIPDPIRNQLIKIKRNKKVRNNRTFEKFMDNIALGDVALKVPDLDGHFWIDIRSHLVRRVVVDGYYEPTVTKAIVSNLSGDFIDIGANVGFYSIHVAKQGLNQGKIVALEPNPRAFNYLSRNIEYNELKDKVIPLQLAASSETRDLNLTVVEGLEEYSTLTEVSHPGTSGLETQNVTVEAKPLDTVVREMNLQPGLIKVDAEGAELDVFYGMKETLSNYRSVLICEIGGGTFGSDIPQIAKYFDDLNYNLYGLKGEPVDLENDNISEIVAKPKL